MPDNMDNDELELGEVLQTELVRRVMALEGREESLRVSNAKLETTIEALDECTQVSREDIVEIARELSRAATGKDVSGRVNIPYLRHKKSTYSRAVGLVLVVLLATVAFTFLKPESGSDRNNSADASVNEDGILGDGNDKIFDNYRKKAELISAISEASLLRMMLVEYYYSEGEYPDSIDALGYDSKSLVSRNIAGVTLEGKGTLVVHLPETFGSNKHFKLAPSFAMGGTLIEWECVANLPTSMLIGVQCEQG